MQNREEMSQREVVQSRIIVLPTNMKSNTLLAIWIGREKHSKKVTQAVSPSRFPRPFPTRCRRRQRRALRLTFGTDHAHHHFEDNKNMLTTGKWIFDPDEIGVLRIAPDRVDEIRENARTCIFVQDQASSSGPPPALLRPQGRLNSSAISKNKLCGMLSYYVRECICFRVQGLKLQFLNTSRILRLWKVTFCGYPHVNL